MLAKNGAKSEKMYSEFPPQKIQSLCSWSETRVLENVYTLAMALTTVKSGISRLTTWLDKVTEITAGIECHQIHSQHIENLHL